MELINRRRRQIAVHSVIYYKFDENIISDYDFDKWSRELADLQVAYPEIAKKAVFSEEFADFDGSTGCHLITIPYAINKAEQLLSYRRGSE